jgi:hypothetical protein
VAGLLALVANTLTTGLGGAVARDVADLTTCRRRKEVSFMLNSASVEREKGYTNSCSTSGPGCSHGPCGRIHRRSSRSGDGQSHRRSSHHHHHQRSYHHPGSSCGQCGRPGRTCSTPGHHRKHRHRSWHRRPGGTRETGDRSGHSGSRCAPWEARGTRGLERWGWLVGD